MVEEIGLEFKRTRLECLESSSYLILSFPGLGTQSGLIKMLKKESRRIGHTR